MPKPHPEPASEPIPSVLSPAAVSLNAGVRRHLGQNLRTLYADTLAAPVSQRLEALIAQLDKAKR